MMSFNKLSSSEINKIKAFYCDEYVPINVNYVNIQEYWNNLSIVEKEKLLVIDETNIIKGLSEIFTTYFNQYPDLENKTQIIQQENQLCYLDVLQTNSINSMIQNNDIQMLLDLFVIIQNNICASKKEDELEDYDELNIAAYDILRGKEKLIKVKTPLINNVFETFKYIFTDFCQGEKYIIKQSEYSELYVMINENQFNDDFNNNIKIILDKKLAEILQLSSILLENNIINSYIKNKNPEQHLQEFKGCQFINTSANERKDLKQFLIKPKNITEMDYDTDSSSVYDSDDETITNDTDEILNQQKETEDQLLENALSGKKFNGENNFRKFISPNDNTQNFQFQEYDFQSYQYFNPQNMMYDPNMYFPQDLLNYDYNHFQSPNFLQMNNNKNYNYNKSYNYQRSNNNYYQENYQQDYQFRKQYNVRDSYQKRNMKKNSFDNEKSGGYRYYNYRNNNQNYYENNYDQDQVKSPQYKRNNDNIYEKQNSSNNSRNKKYQTKQNSQYTYVKKTEYEDRYSSRSNYVH